MVIFWANSTLVPNVGLTSSGGYWKVVHGLRYRSWGHDHLSGGSMSCWHLMSTWHTGKCTSTLLPHTRYWPLWSIWGVLTFSALQTWSQNRQCHAPTHIRCMCKGICILCCGTGGVLSYLTLSTHVVQLTRLWLHPWLNHGYFLG